MAAGDKQGSLVPTLAGLRILIVEDEYLLADDLARAVRQAGAVPLGPVATIAQAEGLLASETVDGAILDLNLRGAMTGDLVHRLSSRRLPCVIVSGYSADALPDRIRTVPRLEKPVNASAAVARLAAEVERSHDSLAT